MHHTTVSCELIPRGGPYSRVEWNPSPRRPGAVEPEAGARRAARAAATWLWLVVALVTGGCADEAGTGTLSVEVWGEDFVEQGIPAGEFVDGWSVTFDRFLVAIDGIAVGQGDSAPDLQDDVQRVFDLTRPGPLTVTDDEVPAGRYDRTTYRVQPVGEGAQLGNAEPADLELLRTGGYSVYAEGTATQDGETKTFAWGFTRTTTYEHCESQAQVVPGESVAVQLTLHADHLFYDDLFAEEPNVTFDLLAQADRDGDGEVTAAELEAYDITPLPNYGTGSEPVDNLWDFIQHLTGTLGHIDGEGHCQARPGSTR